MPVSFSAALPSPPTAVVSFGLGLMASTLAFFLAYFPSIMPEMLDERMADELKHLSPHTNALMRLISAVRQPPLTTVQKMRAAWEANFSIFTASGKQALVKTTLLNGVPVEVTRAKVPSELRSAGAVCHFHGGGYVTCHPVNFRGFAAELSHRLGGVDVVTPDYRLVPEADFVKDQLEDCFQVYKWVVEHYGANSVALVGDSSGGGLAADVLALAALRNVPLPSCVALISPFIDLTLSYTSISDPTLIRNDLFLSPIELTTIGALCLQGRPPSAVPALRDDILVGHASMFPPILVTNASLEIMRGDGEQYVERLKRFGAKEVELLIVRGAVHAFPATANQMEICDYGCNYLCNFLRGGMARSKAKKCSVLPD